MPHLKADFIVERLEVIGSSADEKESGNEIAERMLSYLKSHKNGNEAEIIKALSIWKAETKGLKHWLASYLSEKYK